MEPKLLRDIVELDYDRIVSRLRSKHAAATSKTQGKQPLVSFLNTTMLDPSIIQKKGILLSNLRSLINQLLLASNAFEHRAHNSAEEKESVELLIEVISQAYRLSIREDLRLALATSSRIDPGLKDFFPKALKKLGRYFCACKDIINAARSHEFSRFKQVTVEVLPTASGQSKIPRLTSNFDDVLSRVTNRTSTTRKNRGYQYGPLNGVERDFNSLCQSQGQHCKVHAEIQLLLFYDAHPELPAPRFLCSSKTACYLCDLLIKTHGHFITPSTHGTLYEKWRVPSLPDHVTIDPNVIGRLNTALEHKIISVLKARRVSMPSRDESDLAFHSPCTSMSTLVGLVDSVASSVVSARDQLDHIAVDPALFNVQEEIVVIPSPKNISGASLRSTTMPEPPSQSPDNPQGHGGGGRDSPPAPISATQFPEVLLRASTPESSHTLRRIEENTLDDPLLVSSTTEHELTRGIWTCAHLRDPHECVLVCAGSVRLYLAADQASLQGNPSRRRSVQIKWLTPKDLEGESCRNLEPIDIKSLAPGCDMVVQDGAARSVNMLLLKAKAEHFLVQYSFARLVQGRHTM